MKEIFDTYIENAFCEYKQADFKFKQFEINYKRYFPRNKKSSVLDIGIGRGEMLTCMSNWGYSDYMGVDISPSAVKFCNKLGLKCMLVKDTNNFLKENENTYNLITLIDVLEHVPKKDVLIFLKNIKESLRNNGVLIIQVPNLQAPDGQLHRYNDITHEVGYTEHSLAQVLIASGFESFHFQGFEEFVSMRYKVIIKKAFRYFFWKFVRFNRLINANINPKILNPVFAAIVHKSK